MTFSTAFSSFLETIDACCPFSKLQGNIKLIFSYNPQRKKNTYSFASNIGERRKALSAHEQISFMAYSHGKWEEDFKTLCNYLYTHYAMIFTPNTSLNMEVFLDKTSFKNHQVHFLIKSKKRAQNSIFPNLGRNNLVEFFEQNQEKAQHLISHGSQESWMISADGYQEWIIDSDCAARAFGIYSLGSQTRKPWYEQKLGSYTTISKIVPHQDALEDFSQFCTSIKSQS